MKDSRNRTIITLPLFGALFVQPSTAPEHGAAYGAECAAKRISQMSPAHGPGIQYVVAGRSGVLYERSTGFADVKNKVPLSMSHTMAAFSMTKTLTAMAILQLSEKEKVDLDAPVARYGKHPYDQGITVRQLVCHTSGLPDPIPLKWVHLAKDHQSFHENSALASVLAEHAKPDNLPGTKYRYSNINYWLLGGVIETVTGKSFSAYIRSNIFQPLRISPEQIGFTYSDAVLHAKGYLAKYSFMNLIKRFVTNKEVWGAYEGDWLHIRDVYVNGPAFGGAIGTARSFCIILQDLLAERSVLLNNKSRGLLFSPQKTNSDKKTGMTLGWHIGDLDGVPYYYKEGGGAGFHSEMRVYPSPGLATVIMTNQTSFNSRSRLSELDGLFLKH